MNQHSSKTCNRLARAALLGLLCLGMLVLFQVPETALAQTRDKISQGNNMNFTITATNRGPWFGRVGSARTQWPKGSATQYGGLISSSGGSPVAGAARDLDGNGTYEDTVLSQNRHGEMRGYLSTPSAEEQIKAWHAGGNVMSSITTDLFYNRVYSSLNVNDYPDDWPVEFRDASGNPVTKGDETIVIRTSDTFNQELRNGDAPMGISCELAHYFLSFGMNRDIVYIDEKFQNMSEYVIYNDNPEYAAKSPPGGVTWNGVIIGYGTTQAYAGARDDCWGILSYKDLGVNYDKNGTESWGMDVALTGYKVLKRPVWNGLEAKLLASTTGWCSGFGTSDPNEDPMDYSEDHTPYRWAAHLNKSSGEQTGPYGAVQGTTALVWDWPGVSYGPEDFWWTHWRFTAASYGDLTTTYGPFDGVAPRDTFTMAMAIMFALPGGDGKLLFDNNYPTTLSMEAHCTTIVELSDFAQESFDAGLQTPMPPVVPKLTIIPGDRKVTITWDDVSITTPDPYWALLEESGSNPLGNYKKFDFAGFKLFRCFTGPGDPNHEDLLGTWNYPEVPFYYVDEWAKELQIYSGAPRLVNGFRAWYALTAFDNNNVLNPDGTIDHAFSLESGKTWNNSIQDYYQIIPRSDASDFKAASLLSSTFVPPTGATGTVVSASTVKLTGDGTGKLTEAPKFLEPQVNVTFVPLNNQRIKQDFTNYIVCSAMPVDWGGCNWSTGLRTMNLLNGSGTVLDKPTDIELSGGDETRAFQAFMDFSNFDLNADRAVDAQGLNYAVEITFQDLPDYKWSFLIYADIDVGTYAGDVSTPLDRCDPYVGSNPGVGAWLRSGVFELTWATSGGDLTLQVVDQTRGLTIPFTAHPEDMGWGFMPEGSYYDFYDDMKSGDRSMEMLQTIPTTNTDEFGIWVNGLPWVVSGGTAMPAAGSKWVVTNCLGEWNDDQTVFTQFADAPYIGDKWEIKVTAMSQKAADADLSQIKVVPNPYIVTSALDNSPSQRRIEFVNLPSKCTIRIYTLGGNLVQVLNHIGSNRFGWGDYRNKDRETKPDVPWIDSGWDRQSGTEPWNLRNRFGATVASGLYFYHVTDQLGETITGRFYIVN